MNTALPILVWISLWAAVIVFGFMIVLYLFLMLMGKEELQELRAESDADIRDVRRAEQVAMEEKRERQDERKRARQQDAAEDKPQDAGPD
jgi:Sec-independent protein translocase protein TatA